MLASDRPGPEADLLREVAGIRHEHLVPMRLLDSSPERVGLVRLRAPGHTLAALLRERGSVGPGECVTVLVPLARAVAAVHAAGFLVGGLEAAHVHLDDAGRPLLALPRLPSAAVPAPTSGSCGEPWDEDVRDLARLGWTLLTGMRPDDSAESLLSRVPAAPRALVALVTAVLDAPPGQLPAAAELAPALLAACRPQPVSTPPQWSEQRDRRAPSTGRLDQGPPGDDRDGADEGASPAVANRGRARTRRAEDGSSSRRRLGARPPIRRATSGGGRRRRVEGRPKRRHVSRHGLALAAGALTVALAAVVVLVAWQPHLVPGTARSRLAVRSERPSAPAATASPSATPAGPSSSPVPTSQHGWRAVFAELDRRRSAAVERLDPSALGRVYAPGSPAYARDSALIAAYRAQHARVVGLRDQLVSVTSAPLEPPDTRASGPDVAPGGGVRLLVREGLSAYDVVTATGATIRHGAGDVRTWAVEIRAVGDEWRIWDLQLVTGAGAA